MDAILHNFWHNFTHNLFQPLLLFFYMGFLIPLLKVPFEFPKQIYQGLTLYLLVAIGWEGGILLAKQPNDVLLRAAGFVLVGFITNFFIGVFAYIILRQFTRLRNVDAATVAGYYGSDSAGTFVTCTGVLTTLGIAYDAYMPVLLAAMEIPGCLVALYLVSRLRATGMDAMGNMPYEPGYDPSHIRPDSGDEHGHGSHSRKSAVKADPDVKKFINWTLLHEVFLNPGLYLLFGGIFVGYISGLQGEKVYHAPEELFNTMFKGLLCLFLLEMGITACSRLRDLKTAGIRFILFALIMPSILSTIGMCIAHIFALCVGHEFELGTYVLFGVLCGASSYIAVPAVQRLAIPEASPTLPLAASLGCTFTFNVTVGISLYIEIAKALIQFFPHPGAA
jgi:hypothetical protein